MATSTSNEASTAAVEAGHSKHRLQHSAKGAELAADVLGEVCAGVAPGRIVGGVVEHR
jgi:hypothetical protein